MQDYYHPRSRIWLFWIRCRGRQHRLIVTARGRIRLPDHPRLDQERLAVLLGQKRPAPCVRALLAIQHQAWRTDDAVQIGPNATVTCRSIPWPLVDRLRLAWQGRGPWRPSDGWTVEQARLRRQAAGRFFQPLLQALAAGGIEARLHDFDFDPEAAWPPQVRLNHITPLLTLEAGQWVVQPDALTVPLGWDRCPVCGDEYRFSDKAAAHAKTPEHQARVLAVIDAAARAWGHPMRLPDGGPL